MTKKRNNPSAEEILAYIKQNPSYASKRDIVRHFSIKGPDKITLKRTLKEMSETGQLATDHAKKFRSTDSLPPVTIIEFSHIDPGGDLILKTPQIKLDEKPVIRLDSASKKYAAMGPGDRALARLIKTSSTRQTYRAKIIKRLESHSSHLLGVFRGGAHGGRLIPVDKKIREEYIIRDDDTGGAEDGELVLCSHLANKSRRHLVKGAKVLERLGDVHAPKSISLIAIHTNEIPTVFPDVAVEQAASAKQPSFKGRTDLRSVPLITIDPIDARDHDDAIFAEPDTDPANAGGWHAIIAIADVAAFVTPGSPLDKEAYLRGNSCYFPDRVVPMLPETLSNGLCSLKPGEDRAALICHIWYDSTGFKRRHKFDRAVIQSHANISYEKVQCALDGKPDEATRPFLKTVLEPLNQCFKALMMARAAREPLDLDLPEKKIIMNDEGEVIDIVERERFDAHRIVEELMISANVAAAEQLEAHRIYPLYRVHEEPPSAKLDTLRDFLKSQELTLTKGAVMQPRLFNGILRQTADEARGPQVHEMILRSQTQAYYGPETLGHFGLALPRYAHFTSPIRRYADLVTHRNLISALKLGEGGWRPEKPEELKEIGEHISKTERRAMTAERQSTQRYVASYLEKHIGEDFEARVSGITRAGMFVTLHPSGGDGLLPMRSLGDDYYHHDEARQCLIGQKTGKTYHLGDVITVRLEAANRYSGGMELALIDEKTGTNKRIRRSRAYIKPGTRKTRRNK